MLFYNQKKKKKKKKNDTSDQTLFHAAINFNEEDQIRNLPKTLYTANVVRVCCFRIVFHIRYENNNESRGYRQEGEIFGSSGVVGRNFVSARYVQTIPLNI